MVIISFSLPNFESCSSLLEFFPGEAADMATQAVADTVDRGHSHTRTKSLCYCIAKQEKECWIEWIAGRYSRWREPPHWPQKILVVLYGKPHEAKCWMQWNVARDWKLNFFFLSRKHSCEKKSLTNAAKYLELLQVTSCIKTDIVWYFWNFFDKIFQSSCEITGQKSDRWLWKI